MNGNISFILVAYNESKRIRYVLENLKGWGKILIVDDESEDDTVAIAREYTDLIVSQRRRGWAEDEASMNFVLSQAPTDWVYYGFVDELLAKPLLEVMVKLSNQDKYKLVHINRKNLNYGGVNLRNGTTCRFWKKGAIDFKGNLFGHFGKIVVPPSEQLTLPLTDQYSIWHFSTYDVSRFELGHSKYSTLEAKSLADGGKKFSGFKLIVKPIYYFLNYLLIGGAWRWGWRGLIIAANYCFYFFNTEAKMWEIEHAVTSETIEAQYNRMKEKFLRQFTNDHNT